MPLDGWKLGKQKQMQLQNMSNKTKENFYYKHYGLKDCQIGFRYFQSTLNNHSKKVGVEDGLLC